MGGLGFYFWLAAGAGALWIEAHRQFYHPANRSNMTYGRYPVLAGVGVEELSPARIQARGYFFYVAIYLALYLLFVLTTELGDIVLRVATSQQQSGPQDIYAFTDGAAPIQPTGETRPLAIALAMITLQSLGAVSRVEIILRNFAHRLAGIPHSVYRMIRRLNEIDYDGAQKSGTHCKLFDTYFSNLPDTAQKLFSKEDLEALHHDLQVIDVLGPSTVGTFRDHVFPIQSVANLDDLLEKQEDENQTLEELLTSPPPEPYGPDEMRGLMQQVQLAARNHKALFAVLYSRTPEREIAEVHAPTTHVVNRLKAGDTTLARDSVLMALLIGTIFAFFLSIAIEVGLRVSAATPDSYVSERLLDGCALSRQPGDDGALTGPIGCDPPEKDLSGLSFTERFRTMLADNWELVRINAINDTSQASVAMLFAMLAALTARMWRIDFNTWKADWSFRRFPIKQMLLTALLPALAGAAAGIGTLVAFDASAAWISSRVAPDARELAGFVSFQLYAFPRLFILSLIVSVSVLVVVDQYMRKPAWMTISTTACLSGFFLGLLWLFWWLSATLGVAVGTQGETGMDWNIGAAVQVLIDTRSATLLSVYAWLTTVLFAVFVELGEDPDTKARTLEARKKAEARQKAEARE